MTEQAGDRKMAVAIFLALQLVYLGFEHTRDWNTASRLLLSYALVQDRSVAISPYVTYEGQLARNPLTWDLSSANHRDYYCDKAPAQSFVGAAGLWLLQRFTTLPGQPKNIGPAPLDAATFSRWPTDRWLTWLSSGLATAWSAALVFSCLRRWKCPRQTATAFALAFGLATPAYTYATLFYGHTLAGLFAILTVTFLMCEPVAKWAQVACFFGAGLSVGLAVTTEYTLAALLLATLMVGFFTGIRERTGFANGFAFLAGGAIPAVLLALYHHAVTDDYFTPAYRFEVHPDFAAVHRQGGGIPIQLPVPEALFSLLVSYHRGLLFHAPLVLAAIPGWLWASASRRQSRIANLCLLTSALLILLIAGFPNWDGGLSAGPRFLVPLLPLLFLLAGLGWSAASSVYHRIWKYPLAFATILAGWLALALNTAGGRHPTNKSLIEFFAAASDTTNPESPLGPWLLQMLPTISPWQQSLFGLGLAELLLVLVLLRLSPANAAIQRISSV